MSRRRMIDPDMWEDEKFAKLNFIGRLLFIGLITQANDYGKLRGNPKLLKSKIFPYDWEIKIIEELNSIKDLGLITIYELNNETFIKIKNWNKHQTLTYLGKDSIPDPDNIHNNNNSIGHKIREREGSKLNSQQTQNKPLTNPEETLNKFSSLWERYPNKLGKKEAFRHFKSSVRTEEDLKNINQALNNYLSNLKVETWKSPQNAKTWFNNWTDWIDYVDPEKKIKEYTEKQKKEIQKKKDDEWKKQKEESEQVDTEEIKKHSREFRKKLHKK